MKYLGWTHAAACLAVLLAACSDPAAQIDVNPVGDGDDSGDGDDIRNDGDGDQGYDDASGDGDRNGDESAAANGCEGARLPAITQDVGERGPWKVGVRTVTIGSLVTEVFYPAKPGNLACPERVQRRSQSSVEAARHRSLSFSDTQRRIMQ